VEGRLAPCGRARHSPTKRSVSGLREFHRIAVAKLAPDARIILNNGEHVGFIREDGSFSMYGAARGAKTYLPCSD